MLQLNISAAYEEISLLKVIHPVWKKKKIKKRKNLSYYTHEKVNQASKEEKKKKKLPLDAILSWHAYSVGEQHERTREK